MQSDTKKQTLITDEQRQSHEWIILIRKLRCIGLHASADRLKQILDFVKLQNGHDTDIS
jgi:hypothetical protein